MKSFNSTYLRITVGILLAPFIGKHYSKSQLKTMKPDIKRIAVPCCKTIEFVQLDQIIRFEGLQNYTRVFLSSSEMIVSKEGIGFYKKNLEGHGFFSCHKSHMVNESHIKRFHKEGYLEMVDTSTVPLARRRKDALYKLMEKNFSVGINGRGSPIIRDTDRKSLIHDKSELEP